MKWLVLFMVAVTATGYIVRDNRVSEKRVAFCPDVDGKSVAKVYIQQTGETRCYYVPKDLRRKM